MATMTKLTTNDILEKEFRSEIRGYSQGEVDEYLDLIIQDYATFEKEVAQLRKQNEALQRDLQAATQRAQVASQAVPVQNVPTTRTESAQFTNYDVIKRVAQLERQVALIEKQLQSEPTHPVIPAPISVETPLTQQEIEQTLQFTFTK